MQVKIIDCFVDFGVVFGDHQNWQNILNSSVEILIKQKLAQLKTKDSANFWALFVLNKLYIRMSRNSNNADYEHNCQRKSICCGRQH
jgi:hypothetical protein